MAIGNQYCAVNLSCGLFGTRHHKARKYCCNPHAGWFSLDLQVVSNFSAPLTRSFPCTRHNWLAESHDLPRTRRSFHWAVRKPYGISSCRPACLSYDTHIFSSNHSLSSSDFALVNCSRSIFAQGKLIWSLIGAATAQATLVSHSRWLRELCGN